MPNLEIVHNINPELDSKINQAVDVLDVYSKSSIVKPTEFFKIPLLSATYDADIIFASEVHQEIRAYKIRGAFNAVHDFAENSSKRDVAKGVVTASAGNHAQGIALSCKELGLKSRIYMPKTTPQQKIDRVRELGDENTEIILVGNIVDSSLSAARRDCRETGAKYISPFDDKLVVAGQGTWGVEIAESISNIDMVFCPVGGMGLIAGISTAIKSRQPRAKIIGVEPVGAASLNRALEIGHAAAIKEKIDIFVDGAAVKKVGNIPFDFAHHLVDKAETVTNDEARTATTYLREQANPIEVELAGSLALAGLRKNMRRLHGKRVVCMISGGNLSQQRYEDVVKVYPSYYRHSA